MGNGGNPLDTLDGDRPQYWESRVREGDCSGHSGPMAVVIFS